MLLRRSSITTTTHFSLTVSVIDNHMLLFFFLSYILTFRRVRIAYEFIVYVDRSNED